MSKDFRDLVIWQNAKELTKIIYGLTKNQFFNNDWGLRDQIRRSAISILSNIAEGSNRSSKNEFKRFLKIAKGSCSELLSQCIIADELGYFEQVDEIKEIIKNIEILIKMIGKFLTSLDKFTNT